MLSYSKKNLIPPTKLREVEKETGLGEKRFGVMQLRCAWWAGKDLGVAFRKGLGPTSVILKAMRTDVLRANR